MAAVFPQAPIGAELDLYLSAWTNVSSYIYQRTPIQIGRGRPNQASQLQAASAALALKNADGRFSVNNPVGAYYGLLVRNSPARLSLPTSLLPAPYNTTYLRIEDDAVSYASCPAAARIELTGSLDVRVDVDLSGYGQETLAAVWQASAGVDQRAWKLGLLDTGQLSFNWTTGGTVGTASSAHSSASNPLPVGRLVVRATLDVTTGNVAFYTAPAGAIATGPWTQLGQTITGSGATSVFASTTAPLTVGYSSGLNYDNPLILGPTGAFYDMELRSGIGGTVVAKPAFNAQTAGATSWTDAPGNTWSVAGTAGLTNRDYRFHGEFASAVKGTDTTGNDVFVQATLAGVLQRLQQGQTPLNSPMYRAVVRAAGLYAPVAYWPCEDGASATQIASAIGGTAMSFSGTPTLASSNAFVCSAPLPALNGAAFTGSVPGAGVTWNANVIRFLLAVPAGGEANGSVIASIYTAGTVARVDVAYATTSSGSLTFSGYSGTGAQLWSLTPINYSGTPVNGALAEIEVKLTASGGTVSANISTLLVGASGTSGNLTTTSGSIGAVTRIVLNPAGALTQSVIGHVGVQSSWDGGLLGGAQPLNAWQGESAAARYFRLCTEEGEQARIYGHPALTMPMGYQSLATLPALLQECEDADRGMQYEPRVCLGLGYRTRASLYNPATVATASFPAAAFAPGLSPVTDDLMTLNDVTAANKDGSSARTYQATGAMSVLAPPLGVSRVDTSIPVNIQSDGQLASLANWILHVRTDAHDRIPVLPFNMARSATPRSVALLDVGDMLVTTSPPVWVQPDEIDQLSVGFTETFGPLAVWEIDVNGVPAYPYTIAQVAGTGGKATRADTDGSTLAAGVTSSATTLSVATASGFPIWTSDDSQFPFDVQMGGERLTVTSIGTQIGTTDGTFESGVSGWGPTGCTFVQSSAFAHAGTHSGLMTPDGVTATVIVMSDYIAVTPGASYYASGWYYMPTGYSGVQLRVNWYSGATGTGFVSSANVAQTVPAGTWTFFSATFTAPGSGVASARIEPLLGSTPPVTALLYVDSLCFFPAAGPQPFTVTRSVNGVVKAQTAGTALSLWYPATVAL